MLPNSPWYKAWLAAGLVASAILPVHSREAEPHKGHATPQGVHHARSDDGVGEGQHHLYYRPFCRRSHYVTNRSAPCWE